jgi:hypothetical protein
MWGAWGWQAEGSKEGVSRLNEKAPGRSSQHVGVRICAEMVVEDSTEGRGTQGGCVD